MKINTKKTKTVARFVVGVSVMYTVNSIIKSNTDPETRRQQLEVAIGAMAIGGTIAGLTKTWTNKQCDELFDALKELNIITVVEDQK